MCLWKYVLKLNFEDSRAMDRIIASMSKDEIVDSERCCFTSFVNRVLEQSLGDIDEMRIKFDLDNLCKFDIDKWNNLAIEHSPAFPNLKHLELYVVADFDDSLLGWIPLINACPILQKLTLKASHPSLCSCFCEVILDVMSLMHMEPIEYAFFRAKSLEDKIPNGAKLVIKRG
uniref:Uncharacterized protein n=1 Tax=Chenopodium quinoa TaxID=63459 RepID=A0A803LAR4_CHEQI